MHLCVCDILCLSGFPLGTCKVMVADVGGQEVKKLDEQDLQPKHPHLFSPLRLGAVMQTKNCSVVYSELNQLLAH